MDSNEIAEEFQVKCVKLQCPYVAHLVAETSKLKAKIY
jgi:hypothetical protein